MEENKYSYKINVTSEQYKQLTNFTEGPIVLTVKNIEAFEGVIKLLAEEGYKPYRTGMYREETMQIFPWYLLTDYENVIDFQLDWPYA